MIHRLFDSILCAEQRPGTSAATQHSTEGVTVGGSEEQPSRRRNEREIFCAPSHVSVPQELHKRQQPSTQGTTASTAHSRHSPQINRIHERTDPFPNPDSTLPDHDPGSLDPSSSQYIWENFQPDALFPRNCDESILQFSIQHDEHTSNINHQGKTSGKPMHRSKDKTQIDTQRENVQLPLQTNPASEQMHTAVHGGRPRQEWPLQYLDGSMDGVPENANSYNEWPYPSGGWFSVMPTMLNAQDW